MSFFAVLGIGAIDLVLAGIAVLLGAALVSAASARRSIGPLAAYGTTLVVCSLSTLLALGVLVDSTAAERWLPIGLPWIGASFRVDSAAAFFLIIVNMGGATASLYGLGYGAHEREPGRVLPFFPAFIAAMNTVIVADDAFTFLLSWEFMSLTSWALVVAHHDDAGNRRAAYLYLVMASGGTLTLLLAFGVLAPDGDYRFASMRALAPDEARAGIVFVLALIGCGSKAGIVPLHAWLPLAHPAAPSHVSALMSGVMTKVAIYGFVRIVFDLLGQPANWWSVVVLAAGGITAVVGVLLAIVQDDLKRLLAYSTIENVGMVFVGLGLALGFESGGLPLPAALALVAALFHALNHSLFKSVLFYGAGAVHASTHERSIERLGGLIHRMPVAAFAFLAAAMAVSALPPLNGFVSEWLTFQAILVSPVLDAWSLKYLIPAVGAMLALAAALAAACFVKAFGLTFLGRPRSPASELASDAGAWARAAMLFPVALCVAIGIAPGYVIDALAPITATFVGGGLPAQSARSWFTIVPIDSARSSYSGFYVLLFAALTAFIAAFAIHRLATRALRRAPAWDCGYPDSSAVLQYSSGSFAQPIRRVFGTLLFQAREHVVMPRPGEMRPAQFSVVIRDLLWEGLYAPIGRYVDWASERANRARLLTIRQYLGLVFIALVSLLSLLAFWQ